MMDERQEKRYAVSSEINKSQILSDQFQFRQFKTPFTDDISIWFPGITYHINTSLNKKPYIPRYGMAACGNALRFQIREYVRYDGGMFLIRMFLWEPLDVQYPALI
jgi:hypothetical protein